MTYSQMSRIQVRNQNELMGPGKCVLCGSVTGEFVDFGFELDFYGVVYFCLKDCFTEAAQQLGYVKEELVEKRDQIIANMDQVNISLELENSELRDALGIIDRVRSNTVDDNQLELAIDEDPVEDSDESTGEDDPIAAESDSGTNESDDESGSTDVLDDDIISQLADI